MIERILVIPRQAIGETVISQILYKILKQRYDDVKIDVLTSSDYHPILSRMPEVNKTIDILKNIRLGSKANKFLRIKDLLLLGFSLDRSYNQIIIIENFRQFSLMAKWIAQIPVRTGFSTRNLDFFNDVRTPLKDAFAGLILHEIHLSQPPNTPFIDYQSVGPFPELIVDAKNAEACIKRLGLGTVGHQAFPNETPILILVPGAHNTQQPSKIWPYHHFCEVANYYGIRGWQIWILGSKKEYQIGERITKSTKVSVHNLCGKTEVIDTIDLLSRAHLVIGNDSGLMHIAAAVGCFVVVIHGSFSSTTTLYFTKKLKQLHYKLPCSNCSSAVCRYGHYRCLTEITSADVIAAANDLIGKDNITFCD